MKQSFICSPTLPVMACLSQPDRAPIVLPANTRDQSSTCYKLPCVGSWIRARLSLLCQKHLTDFSLPTDVIAWI
eukprot:752303-Hanusia_phi.AAC.2